VAGAATAPAKDDPDAAAPAEGGADTGAPAEKAQDTTAPAKEAPDTAAAAEGGPEPEDDLTERDATGPDYTGPDYTGPDYTGSDLAEDGFAGPDFAETDSQPVSKLAIVSLVTGLVALVPIAVASGVASLTGIRRTGRRGHGMAMAGLFMSAAWVIVAVAIGTVALLTHGFHKPVTIKYNESAIFKLHEGDCVDNPDGQLVSILPCSTPHEAEVFATFALPGSRWPGTATIATEASSGCVGRLNGYLNPQLAISLSQSFVYPNRVDWTAGTRTVICEVRASSGQLTGSVRGAVLTGNGPSVTTRSPRSSRTVVAVSGARSLFPPLIWPALVAIHSMTRWYARSRSAGPMASRS
jgi:hypothetical protein